MKYRNLLAMGLIMIIAAFGVAGCGSSNETTVTFTDSGVEIDGSGASADGTTVTITSGGTYTVSGTSDDAQIVVSASDTADVTIVLNDVELTNEEEAVIYEEQAGSLTVTSASGSEKKNMKQRLKRLRHLRRYRRLNFTRPHQRRVKKQ